MRKIKALGEKAIEKIPKQIMTQEKAESSSFKATENMSVQLTRDGMIQLFRLQRYCIENRVKNSSVLYEDCWMVNFVTGFRIFEY